MSDYGSFGISRPTIDELRRAFERTPGIDGVWIFGSRARGDARDNSDIDLVIDAPDISDAAFAMLQRRLLDLPTLHTIDAVHWQAVTESRFRTEIERDRRLFWTPSRHPAEAGAVGAIELKAFQSRALETLAEYLAELKRHAAQTQAAVQALAAMEGMEDAAKVAADFPAKTWNALRQQGRLPLAYAARPHSSRWDGAGHAVPNVCLKVPTGGGKTLLAAAGIGGIASQYLGRHTGLVLWIVPNEAIYRQTLKALTDRDHPYRQLLNVAGAGRVKVLEKTSPLTKLDTDNHLCLMLLMLQSAARQSRETLKFFRDRGNVLGFLPREDDIEAHWQLLERVPNLDCYAPTGLSAGETRAQKGSIAKSSLGNVMRLLRPIVVIDEGHHAYSDTALATIDSFNPSFMLELSATPRVADRGSSGSNILVDVRGTDLDAAEMIKLPIQVEVRPWNDWQSCLAASVERLNALQREADVLRAETARYIRPILLVQVERTGADQREDRFIHAEDARNYLMQLGLGERQIAIKTSERNDLNSPENIALLSETCEVRAIVTKQALQEGWDCPFAYVLCSLAAGRNLAAMTQLIGRVLRQPHAAKTGRPALDSCWVFCHDVRTGEVVRAVKGSLEKEGMGDLGFTISGDGTDPELPQMLRSERRPEFSNLRIFIPTVAWVDADGSRRALDYDSDVLGTLPWHMVRTERFATEWAPDPHLPQAQRFALGLDILDRPASALPAEVAEPPPLDRPQIVRALLDLAPNAWLVWDWVEAVVARLLATGLAESALARSTASLIERLRIDLEAERDRLAQDAFERLLAEGRIEFRLRADALDYELPFDDTHQVFGKPKRLVREETGEPIQKSLLAPQWRLGDLNEFEVRVAGYLDEAAAVHWWHRNVAKSQSGLQGWKRHKVYPDFIFALALSENTRRFVLLETKGLHLQGEDTKYKQALFTRLTSAFKDERGRHVGGMELVGAEGARVECDLVFGDAWHGTLAARYFGKDSGTAVPGIG